MNTVKLVVSFALCLFVVGQSFALDEVTERGVVGDLNRVATYASSKSSISGEGLLSVLGVKGSAVIKEAKGFILEGGKLSSEVKGISKIEVRQNESGSWLLLIISIDKKICIAQKDVVDRFNLRGVVDVPMAPNEVVNSYRIGMFGKTKVSAGVTGASPGCLASFVLESKAVSKVSGQG